MQFATTPAALFLTIAPLLIPVSAHGFLRALDVDGKPHHGCTPGTGAGSSSAKTTVIRTIDNTNPLHLSDPKISSHLSCGRGAATRGAPHHAIVKPGSSLAFHWDAGDGSAWPHNSGPMITYIADCGTAGCTKVDSSKLKWWKLNQVGKVSTPGNSWAQGRVHKGKHYTFKLPKDMPNGHFLLGHEIIALHQADKRNGAEFYPSCSQITVTGGSRKKISGKAVTFPGAYKLTDKGLHINVRFGSPWERPFPGPVLAIFGVDEDEDEDEDCSEMVVTTTEHATAPRHASVPNKQTKESKHHSKSTHAYGYHRNNRNGRKRLPSSAD